MKKQLIEGEDYYFNADGYMVLTEKYHLDKGSCCGYGCTHCPFHYENVEEPKRSLLIHQREMHGKSGT